MASRRFCARSASRVVAAPLAEEVAYEPLAVRAPAAAAFGDQSGAAALAGLRSADAAGLAGFGVLAVGLEGCGLPATGLRTLGWLAAHYGGRDEAVGELAAPLGDEGLKVHVGLLSGCRRRGSASVLGQAACARRPVTSRQRGSQRQRRTLRVDRPSTHGSMGNEPTDGTVVWFCGTGRSERCRAERVGPSKSNRWMPDVCSG